MVEDRVERRLAAILIADVVGYSRLVRAGEEETVTQVAALIGDVMEPEIASHRGRVFKKMGDAVLAEFGSTVDALRCAIAVQREIVERTTATVPQSRIAFRIGLHVGDVVVDGDDIQGDGVNVAARIETLAPANGICISEDVFRQVEGRVDAGFENLGPQRLKNIEKSVRVYSIHPEAAWQGRVSTPLATRLQSLRWPATGVLALVIALIVAGQLGLFPIRDPAPTFTPAAVERMAFPLPDRPSIAVLPFDNLSGDPEQAFLGDGLTESIISSLSKVSRMLVIARNSTSVYKGKAATPQMVAEDLGVRYVLAGSVQRAGDDLRATVQLIDAVKGHQIWSERYDRKLADLFAVQDDITREIMVTLQVKLTEGEQARIRAQSTGNLAAWENYVRGLALFERFTEADNASARALLQQAVERDPDFAAAWRLLAWTHMIDSRFGWGASRNESFRSAVTTAETALRLAPDDAEAQALMASLHLYRGNYDEAVSAVRRAVELGPNMADVKATVATVTLAAGDWEQTIELLTSAKRLFPHFPSWYLLYLSRAHVFAGNTEMAIATAENGVARTESEPLRSGFHLILAWIHVESGEMDRAREQMAEALRLNPGYTVTRWRKATFYRDPAHLDRIADALVQAGMPE